MSRFVPVIAAAESLRTLHVPASGLLVELPAMIDAGVLRLNALVHADGGFGWWPTDASNPAMTMQVLHGLNRAAAYLPKGSLGHGLRARAASWLVQALGEERWQWTSEMRAQAHLALAGAKALPKDLRLDTATLDAPRAMAFALRAAQVRKDAGEVARLRRALRAAAQRDGNGVFWARVRPGGSAEHPTKETHDPIQTTAEVGYALLGAGADEALLESAVRWLLLNRPGGDHWRSTRDTAAAVRFLAAYVAKTGDLGVGARIRATVNALEIGRIEVTRESAWKQETVLEVPAELLVPGEELALHLSAEKGGFTAGLHLSFFETGPAIHAGGNGLEITRRWFLLRPQESNGKVTWSRTPFRETVPSGALVECELTVQSAAEREYVMVTDPHAAGFEPAREFGLTVPGRRQAAQAQRERYDDRTLFFVTRMPAGTITLRHILRATHVGRFTALPAQAELMYFPDVRGNSHGRVLEISDAGPQEIGQGGGR
jgi:uncharacterized protein YfaS (alpha-2-macroglobulin family)